MVESYALYTKYKTNDNVFYGNFSVHDLWLHQYLGTTNSCKKKLQKQTKQYKTSRHGRDTKPLSNELHTASETDSCSYATGSTNASHDEQHWRPPRFSKAIDFEAIIDSRIAFKIDVEYPPATSVPREI